MRQSMMPVRYSAINKTSNSGQSMMATVMVTAATCNQKEKIEKHVPTPTEDPKGESSKLNCPVLSPVTDSLLLEVGRKGRPFTNSFIHSFIHTPLNNSYPSRSLFALL